MEQMERNEQTELKEQTEQAANVAVATNVQKEQTENGEQTEQMDQTQQTEQTKQTGLRRRRQRKQRTLQKSDRQQRVNVKWGDPTRMGRGGEQRVGSLQQFSGARERVRQFANSDSGGCHHKCNDHDDFCDSWGS